MHRRVAALPRRGGHRRPLSWRVSHEGGVSEAELLGKTDFINTLISKCLTLHKGDDPRLVIPPLYTVIHFGKAEFIKEYVVFIDSSFPELRKLAYESWDRNDSNKDVFYYLDRVEDKLEATRTIADMYL